MPVGPGRGAERTGCETASNGKSGRKGGVSGERLPCTPRSKSCPISSVGFARGSAMPVHDWTRVPAGILHDFHLEWIATVKHALNRVLTGSEYYALAEQWAGGWGPDILTLQRPECPTSRRPVSIRRREPDGVSRRVIRATLLGLGRSPAESLLLKSVRTSRQCWRCPISPPAFAFILPTNGSGILENRKWSRSATSVITALSPSLSCFRLATSPARGTSTTSFARPAICSLPGFTFRLWTYSRRCAVIPKGFTR